MNGELSFSINDGVLIGKGRRRRCYHLPGTGLCVKFYHAPSDLPKKTRLSVRLEIAWGRWWRTVNVNYLEWRYLQRLRQQVPAEVVDIFPEHTEPVCCPEKGWGIAETLIVNADGSLTRSVAEEIKAAQDAAMCLRIYRAVETLFERFVDHSVCFFDPSNILVQWTGDGGFRLRIADFEPTCRALIPGLTFVQIYVRCKVRRRAARYLTYLRGLLVKKSITKENLPVRPAKPVSIFRRVAAAAGLI